MLSPLRIPLPAPRCQRSRGRGRRRDAAADILHRRPGSGHPGAADPRTPPLHARGLPLHASMRRCSPRTPSTPLNLHVPPMSSSLSTGRAGGTTSGSERPSPAPGFGTARPSSTQSGGTKSATRTDMLVDVGMVAGCDNLEVPRHVGNGSASPAKGTKRKFVVDATKGASPGVNASNTGQYLHYHRKGNGPGKRAKLEDNKGASRLGRDQTPIGVFEDECVFCHSFRTSEPCHGPMVRWYCITIEGLCPVTRATLPTPSMSTRNAWFGPQK
ncbi:uncharacterized protein LOC119296195 [Triticum dicoccoides]|uniref:uncharacterized protein LOC119296195 n=1 Tax=Triticum dicoccoides TaxID=85692 RepID=UPI00188EAE40|nr:uncharacterized protein LOC119296195 [Triticum dicoccoides]XP_037430478.1 uncharacterized protein LOC119296195 [Triticum dicoccoides]XP_037430479.1 uncharacterized protein LOC119296195 [Triticum dicoccoides]XP_037430480.1 uncharacterized protein LOC119296195 [Triticum dicoccoides]XP_037430481.1 uncharacterized protein LOC119296195 [Triticum dicoccoides]XP_037430482.1 uncharacterized protein LOC119296195 [Triticum dicoccoides]XP_037430483.1 uncharacterized protein LOC119296195 [Triticum dic